MSDHPARNTGAVHQSCNNNPNDAVPGGKIIVAGLLVGARARGAISYVQYAVGVPPPRFLWLVYYPKHSRMEAWWRL